MKLKQHNSSFIIMYLFRYQEFEDVNNEQKYKGRPFESSDNIQKKLGHIAWFRGV